VKRRAVPAGRRPTNHKLLATIKLRCSCGAVEYEASGKPILTSICYCDDCQKASREIESLPSAPRILDNNGGTTYVLYRKDRVECVRGEQLLKEYRLAGESFTKRVVASCCNSAMFLDFEKGHWLSLYRDRFEGHAPPLQMRVQTKYKPEGANIPNDLPSSPGFSLGFIVRLLGAKIAMLFGVR
jgi:hypothetical protein